MKHKAMTTEEKEQFLTEIKSCFVCRNSFYRRLRREYICVNPFSVKQGQKVDVLHTCELWAPVKKPKPKEDAAAKESDGS